MMSKGMLLDVGANVTMGDTCTAGGDAFRCLMQRGLEALDRFAKIFGAEVESLMMDWHDEMSASFIGHSHGLFRSAVRMNPGIVSADRHDRQIDGTGSAQLRKRIAQRGIARKNDATVISLENVVVVTAIGIAPFPRAPISYPERDDVDLAGESCYRLYFFPTQFAHVAEPCPRSRSFVHPAVITVVERSNLWSVRMSK
jgi:hypothetical protein